MSDTSSPDSDTRGKLIAVTLDEPSIGRADSKVDHERQVAIYDILEANSFQVNGHESEGPYRLHLSLDDDKLIFAIADQDETSVASHELSLLPFRKILKDYFLVLDSYFKAVREAQPAKIEAIDVGRRGLHDEGSQLLMERLGGAISMDFDTARRLFTLLAALHWKG